MSRAALAVVLVAVAVADPSCAPVNGFDQSERSGAFAQGLGNSPIDLGPAPGMQL